MNFFIDNIFFISFLFVYVYFLREAFYKRKKIGEHRDAIYNERHIGFRLLNWWLYRIFPMWPSHSVMVTSSSIYLYPSTFFIASLLVFKSDLFYEIKLKNLYSISLKNKSLIISHKTELGDKFEIEIYGLNEPEILKTSIETAIGH